MTVKVILYLCLISLARTEEHSQEHDSTAYSSVYTSFGSHITHIDDETPETNTPVANEGSFQSGPIYETINGESNKNNGKEEITDNVSGNNAIQGVNQDSIIYSIPNVQPAQSVFPNTLITATEDTLSTPIFAPVNSKTSTNPPLSSAVIGEGRLLTPGLSAFASSGEEVDNEPGRITIVEVETPTVKAAADLNSVAPDHPSTKAESESRESKPADSQTPESHASFDGFGTSFSW